MSQKYSYHKTLKNAITVIASEFFSFFADQVKLKTGIRPDPNSIIIQSVDIKRNLGRNRELYLVEIPFSSDTGVYETRLFIKLFKDHEKVLQESSGAIQLEELLKGDLDQDIGIMTPKLLYYSKQWNILVYEGIYAEEFENLTQISLEDRMLLIGLTLPKIHGKTIKEVDLQRYYLLLENTMKQLQEIIEYSLPECALELSKVQELLVYELEQRMFYSYSGAISFGDFHTGNLMLETRPLKLRSLVTNNISNNADAINRILVWVLDPEFFDIEIENFDRIDRMEDIANIFTSYLISEFSESNSISKTVKLIEKFIIGYNLEFKKETGITLFDCYPKGSSLEYQISQSLLFDLIYYLKNQFDAEISRSGFNLRINLIKHLLMNRIEFVE